MSWSIRPSDSVLKSGMWQLQGKSFIAFPLQFHIRELKRDGKGRYMLPGLVDIHMHIESSMTYPGEFSRITLPYGVTTVVADAHEMANVFGMDGIRAFMAQKTKQDIFWAIPSSVPATNEKLETSGASLGVTEVSEMAA